MTAQLPIIEEEFPEVFRLMKKLAGVIMLDTKGNVFE